MVCFNCGYENPATHRFCGMCGTPLPQRPITAPGAQSTVAFTRLPIEVTRTKPGGASGSAAGASSAAMAQPKPVAVQAPPRPPETQPSKPEIKEAPVQKAPRSPVPVAATPPASVQERPTVAERPIVREPETQPREVESKPLSAERKQAPALRMPEPRDFRSGCPAPSVPVREAEITEPPVREPERKPEKPTVEHEIPPVREAVARQPEPKSKPEPKPAPLPVERETPPLKHEVRPVPESKRGEIEARAVAHPVVEAPAAKPPEPPRAIVEVPAPKLPEPLRPAASVPSAKPLAEPPTVPDRPAVVARPTTREPEPKPRVVETKPAPPESPRTTPTAVKPAVPAEAKGPGQPVNYFAEAEQAKSLEEFVARFHYRPPEEDEEVTMTGDRPVVEEGVKYQDAAPQGLSDEPTAIADSAAPVVAASTTPTSEAKSTPPPQTPPPETVPRETQTPDRSRFLDLSEPAPEPSRRSGTSTVVGPSFLGLSDQPAAASPVATDLVSEPPAHSHWRAWVALIVVLLFGGMGYLEWRAEKNQSSNGPIGVIKMQIGRLKGKKATVVTPESTPEPAPPSNAPANQPQTNGSGSDMQVTPQQTSPPPSNSQPGGNGTPATDKPADPGAASAQPPATQGGDPAVVAMPGGGSAENSVANGRAAQPTVAPSPTAQSSVSPAPPNHANNGNSQTDNAASRAAKPVPGAEELAKAEDAGDAAAASAWLWKSVAKGNPEAPIRLANMYIKGDGIPRSCEQALVLLKSAAAKENAAARSRLGSLYATGTCVPRDRVRAYQWLSSALRVNPNASWARDFREQLWAQMTPQERELAQRSR